MSKWMYTVEERKAPPPNTRVSEVMMQFFREPVVPVVDEAGKCVGVVHRRDCYEVHLPLLSLFLRTVSGLGFDQDHLHLL